MRQEIGVRSRRRSPRVSVVRGGRHVSSPATTACQPTGTMDGCRVPQGPPSAVLDALRKLERAIVVLRKPRAKLVRHALDRGVVWSRYAICIH